MSQHDQLDELAIRDMWQDKVEATLSDREKELGVDSVYATDAGNIFMVMLKEA